MLESILHIFAWPAVVLILGLVALLLFRTPFADLIKKIERFKSTKFEIQTTAAAQISNTETEIRPLSEEVLSIFDATLLNEQKGKIHKMLEERKIEKGTASCEQELITLLAAAILYNEFDKTYSIIFGSQLGALQVLNQTPPTFSLSTETIRLWYNVGASAHPDIYANYSFD